jgi:hypothetical protein
VHVVKASAFPHDYGDDAESIDVKHTLFTEEIEMKHTCITGRIPGRERTVTNI